MAITDDHGREEPPVATDEVGTLLGFLDWQRATFAWKCQGLDAAQLAATTAASSMTLGGMMKHLALVEDDWFCTNLLGREPGSPWDTVDWDADRDWDWHSAVDDSPEELRGLWNAAVGRARRAVSEALADRDVSQPAARAQRDGTRVSMRWILVHMIEEYARHNGHADLLRESIDGQTGE